MRQALHIFRKDAGHCWPYIAAVLALTAANAWQNSREIPNPSLNIDMNLPLLTGLAWWLAIGAAVHGESLIGDRQFWVTRPYSWKSLLAAKLLFVAVFLGLPTFVSDCITLFASGFAPRPLIPGLLLRQCWLAAFFVLPFVVAALTRLTGRFVLTGLVSYIFLYIGFFLLAVHFVGHGPTHPGIPSWIRDAEPWLAAAAGFSLVVWQYASRRTTLVRALAIALGVLAPVWTAPIHYYIGHAISASPWRDDPRYRSITLQYAPDPGRPSPAAIPGQTRGQIRIPVKVNGWPRELVAYQSSRVIVSTGWASIGSDMTPGSDGRDWIVFRIDDATRRMLPAEVGLSVSCTLKVYERQGSVNLRSDGAWACIPGFGNVRLLEDAAGMSRLIWRTALTPPDPEWRYSLRDTVSGVVTDGEWSGLSYSVPSSPLTFRMSPVYSYPGSVTPHSPPAVFTVNRHTVTINRLVELPPIRLADYEATSQ